MNELIKMLDVDVAKRGDAVLLQALDATVSRWLEAHPQFRGPMRLPNAAGAKRIHETVRTLELRIRPGAQGYCGVRLMLR